MESPRSSRIFGFAGSLWRQQSLLAQRRWMTLRPRVISRSPREQSLIAFQTGARYFGAQSGGIRGTRGCVPRCPSRHPIRFEWCAVDPIPVLGLKAFWLTPMWITVFRAAACQCCALAPMSRASTCRTVFCAGRSFPPQQSFYGVRSPESRHSGAYLLLPFRLGLCPR